MRFAELKYQKITHDMSPEDKKAAIDERWNWFIEHDEQLSAEKIKLLSICLKYAEEAFHDNLTKAAKSQGYDDFNLIFNKIIKQKHKDENTETFLIRIKPHIKLMRHREDPAIRLPSMLEAEMNKQLIHAISDQLSDPTSELSQCKRGFQNISNAAYVLAGLIEIQGIWSRGDYMSGISLAVINTALRYAWLSPYKNESANYATKYLYNNFGTIRHVAKLADYQSWTSMFANGAKIAKDKLQLAASKLSHSGSSNNSPINRR